MVAGIGSCNPCFCRNVKNQVCPGNDRCGNLPNGKIARMIDDSLKILIGGRGHCPSDYLDVMPLVQKFPDERISDEPCPSGDYDLHEAGRYIFIGAIYASIF
jgi:hypothetical protein